MALKLFNEGRIDSPTVIVWVDNEPTELPPGGEMVLTLTPESLISITQKEEQDN